MKGIISVKSVLLVHHLSVHFLCLASVLLLSRAPAVVQEVHPRGLSIFGKWAGDYPVSGLPRLAEGRRSSAVGYLGDEETFSAVWEAFDPGSDVPPVDFSTQLVVFF